jgi:hypothetical protein
VELALQDVELALLQDPTPNTQKRQESGMPPKPLSISATTLFTWEVSHSPPPAAAAVVVACHPLILDAKEAFF